MDNGMDAFARDIFAVKYRGDAANVLEYYERLARLVSLGDAGREKLFFNMMWEKRFSPGGRILAYGGRPDAKLSLMNCTTHEIEGDSLEDISEAIYTVMRASSRGQGVGVDISKLRPKGSPVSNAASTSTGAVSFMEMINKVGSVIGQEGRRAALLFSISDSHPDLYRPGQKDVTCPHCGGTSCGYCNDGLIPYDFLHVKRIPGLVENANISVRLSDSFMEMVKKDGLWQLRFDGMSNGVPFTQQTFVPAKQLFNALVSSAWASAEPGILYWSASQRMSNSDLFGFPVVGVNACSEEILDQDGLCNLGSINLSAYVHEPFTDTAYFDFDQLKHDVTLAVEFLDNVVTLEISGGNYISETQLKSLINLRRIGLGVMGTADMLAMLGYRYGAEPKTIEMLGYVFSAIRDSAYWASAQLAWNKGAAEAWSKSGDYHKSIIKQAFFATLPDRIKAAILRYGIRNITLLSVAPTGTISNLYGVSSGIEPLFAHSYKRRTRINGRDEFIDYVHPGVVRSRMMGLPDSIWPTAYSVSVDDHLAVQTVAQKYVDASISKTLNFRFDATVDDVTTAYMKAWEKGLKGLSVYRDGSRSEQILYTTSDNDSDTCPECGGELIRKDGCVACSSCYWGKCEL